MLIIDANNLAGKLDLLKEKDFDWKLTEIIRTYNKERQKKIVLVFDSNDVMGDKLPDGKLTVIYTPRDSYYRNADDKIVEIIKATQASIQKEQVVVITDDVEIKKKAAELKCVLKDSTRFAEELRENMERHEIADERNNLSDAEMDDITGELLKKWK